MIIILILLMVSPLIADDIIESSGTISKDLTPLTTSQIIIKNIINVATTKESKVVLIDALLDDADYYKSQTGVNIDKITAQVLLNTRSMLKVEIRHEKQGRSYCGNIKYQEYRAVK